MFSSVNNLQIAYVVRRAVFLLFLLCFQPVVCLFLLRKTGEIFHHFSLFYPQAAQARCINYRVFRTKRTLHITNDWQTLYERQMFKKMRNICINIEINFTFVKLSLLLLFLCNLAILHSRLVFCSVLFSSKSLIKCEPSQDTVCSLNSPISPASKNRAPIRYESAKSF